MDVVVEGRQAVIMFDTGASISVVPEELVSKTKLTGESIQVRGYNGISKLRMLARVDLRLVIRF